jgi:hypothetical protein
MNIKLPNSRIEKSSASSPKAGVPKMRKPARLRGFSALGGGKRFPPHFPPQPWPFLREPGAFVRPPLPDAGVYDAELGPPLSIGEVAKLIGVSPWTVRQTLIPRGLPHLRFTASGKLIFYTTQIVRWIENEQQGGKTTK